MASATATESDLVVFATRVSVAKLLEAAILLLRHIDGEEGSTTIITLFTLIDADPFLELQGDIIQLSPILKDLVMLIALISRFIGLHMLTQAGVFLDRFSRFLVHLTLAAASQHVSIRFLGWEVRRLYLIFERHAQTSIEHALTASWQDVVVFRFR